MKTLYESILDVDDLINNNSEILLSAFWKPLTFSSKVGPTELMTLLKELNIKNKPNNNVFWRDYYVMRPWNKKAIMKKVEDLIETILSCMTWKDVESVLKNTKFSISIIEEKDRIYVQVMELSGKFATLIITFERR